MHTFSRNFSLQQWLKNAIIGGDIDTTLPIVVETNSQLDKDLLEFTLPLFYMDGGLLIRKTIAGPGQLLMKPFQVNVWIALGAVMLLTIIYDIFCRILIGRARGRRDTNAYTSILINFAIMTGRSVDVDVPLWSRRVLYAMTGEKIRSNHIQ